MPPLECRCPLTVNQATLKNPSNGDGPDDARVSFVLPADPEAPELVLPPGFDAPGFRADGAGARLGRGGAVAIDWPDGRACFYREYRHGGLFGSVLANRYLSDAPLREEIEACRRLLAAGVAVPEPVVGRVERRAISVSLALVTRRIPGRTLADELAHKGELACRELLRRLGAGIRRMHDAGFRHRDLHPGNVLLRDDGEVAIIDLEGGRWGGRPGDRTAIKSLARFGRYLEKHFGLSPSTRHAFALLAGYEPDVAQRKRLWSRLRSTYRTGMLFHRLAWLRRPWTPPPSSFSMPRGTRTRGAARE